MKKIIISAMLLLSLGLVSCGQSNANGSTANNVQPKTSDGVANSNDQANLTPSTPQTGGEGTPNAPESGTKGITNSNGSQANNVYVTELYSNLKSEMERQDTKIDSASWENFRTDFNNRLSSIKSSADSTELNGTVGYLEQLYDEYDTAIKNNAELGKDKIIELRNKIEDALK